MPKGGSPKKKKSAPSGYMGRASVEAQDRAVAASQRRNRGTVQASASRANSGLGSMIPREIYKQLPKRYGKSAWDR